MSWLYINICVCAFDTGLIYSYIFTRRMVVEQIGFDQLCLNINFTELQVHGGLSLYVYINMHMARRGMVTHSNAAQQIKFWSTVFKPILHRTASSKCVASACLYKCAYDTRLISSDMVTRSHQMRFWSTLLKQVFHPIAGLWWVCVYVYTYTYGTWLTLQWYGIAVGQIRGGGGISRCQYS